MSTASYSGKTGPQRPWPLGTLIQRHKVGLLSWLVPAWGSLWSLCELLHSVFQSNCHFTQFCHVSLNQFVSSRYVHKKCVSVCNFVCDSVCFFLFMPLCDSFKDMSFLSLMFLYLWVGLCRCIHVWFFVLGTICLAYNGEFKTEQNSPSILFSFKFSTKRVLFIQIPLQSPKHFQIVLPETALAVKYTRWSHNRDWEFASVWLTQIHSHGVSQCHNMGDTLPVWNIRPEDKRKVERAFNPN